MTNKITIILGLIAVAIIAGLVWYAGQNREGLADQAASILGGNSQEESGDGQSAGIDEFVLGSLEAPVTMIDYSSHFCGHCINYHNETLPLIIDKYVKTGKVKIVPRLLSPAEISLGVLCAQDQGAFWEFNDYAFEHVQEFASVDDVKAGAGVLGLDEDEFNQCFDSKKYEDKITEWLNQAVEADLEGTPTFFINGQRIVGNQPYSVFEEAIERALEE